MGRDGTLRVRIVGDSKPFEDSIGKLGGFVGKAALAAGAAFVGASAAGVAAFSGFERGMNEVFTLLPGISGDAMADMSGQVKQFSQDFGTLPNEVVPALYQSLSAGVPPDNVFGFLETAQKAALGGVTDLTTAVDGISSVVNAYGADTMAATDASDLLFTAVRLGKTNFEELSANVSKVAPLAASLGIEFGDVTAALAAMTAQGEPTAEASTKIRSALAELGKDGTVAAKAFQDAAGKTFPDFIAEGGNLQQALQIMADQADGTGKSVIDLFGSVEAGTAALMLTSENGAAAFTGALDEMAAASGATDAAFEQMDQGIGRSFDKIKAAGAVALVEIGDRLAPALSDFADMAIDHLPAAMTAITRTFDVVASAVSSVVDVVRRGLDRARPFIDWLEANWQPVVAAAAGVITALLVPAIQAAVATFATAAAPVLAVGAVIAGLGWILAQAGIDFDRIREIAAAAWQHIQAATEQVWPQVQAVIESVTAAVSAIVATATAMFASIWEHNGQRILEFVRSSWDRIRSVIDGALTVIRGIFDVVAGLLTGDWSRLWSGITGILSGAWRVITGVIAQAWDGIKLAFRLAGAAVVELFSGLWERLKSLVSGAWTSLTSSVTSGIDRLVGWFRDLPRRILDAVGNLGSLLADAGRQLIEGLLAGIREKFDQVRDTLRSLTDRLPDWKGPEAVDRRILSGPAAAIMGGFASDLTAEARKQVLPALTDVTGMLTVDAPARPTATGLRRTAGVAGTDLADLISQQTATLERALRELTAEARRQRDVWIDGEKVTEIVDRRLATR